MHPWQSKEEALSNGRKVLYESGIYKKDWQLDCWYSVGCIARKKQYNIEGVH